MRSENRLTVFDKNTKTEGTNRPWFLTIGTETGVRGAQQFKVTSHILIPGGRRIFGLDNQSEAHKLKVYGTR